MKDLGCKWLSKRIRNHEICANMFYRNLATLSSFSTNQELDIDMLLLKRAHDVVKIHEC